ncbi:MAG: DNA topoisomerase, partial [Oscillospiraceae bacterium]
IAESPLYEILTKAGPAFAFDEKEKAAILKKAKGVTKIQRSKGLGENDPDMMWQTTMCPDSRRLIQVIPHKNSKETGRVFDTLLGKDLAARKQIITDHGEEYLDQLDI